MQCCNHTFGKMLWCSVLVMLCSSSLPPYINKWVCNGIDSFTYDEVLCLWWKNISNVNCFGFHTLPITSVTIYIVCHFKCLWLKILSRGFWTLDCWCIKVWMCNPLKALSKSLNIKLFSFMSSIMNVKATFFRQLLKMVLTKV